MQPARTVPSDAIDDDTLRGYREFFASRALIHHARWIGLELDGYHPDATALSLPELLRDAPQSLLAAVSRSRVRRGRVRAGTNGAIVTWPHFFVEPARTLRELGAKIGPVAGEVLIDLAAGYGEPPTLAFTGNVFLDVIDRVGIEIRDAVRSAR